MKRIATVLLCLLMAVTMFQTVTAVAEPATEITVTADKTEVFPGDVITYTITMGAVERMQGFEFKLEVAEGLTYNVGSYQVTENLSGIFGSEKAEFTESSKKFIVYGGGCYTNTAPTQIMTFTCTAGEVGSYTVKLTEIDMSDPEYETVEWTPEEPACTVAVKERPVAVTGVTLDKSSLAVKTGETAVLTATVAPANAANQNVSWKSSDTSVATVSAAGVVTGVKKGTTTITVTTADGSKTATCAVTVACSHADVTEYPAVESTCQTKGHGAYSVCKACGEIVSGSSAELPLAGHAYIEKTAAEDLKSAATCVSKAVYYKSCSVCGVKGTETFESGAVDAANHTGETYVEGQKEATCFEEGYTGDTYCADCRALVAAGTVIAMGEHNPANVWSTDAENHWKDCQTVGCGNVINKAAHNGGEATCTKKAICAVCGVEYGEVNPDNHAATEVRGAVAATCTEDGYTGDTYCVACDTCLATGNVIPAGHDIVKVEAKEATHEEDGNIEYFVCQMCGEIYADAEGTTALELSDTVIAKGEHAYSEEFAFDAENHWKACECGSKIEVAAHTMTEWIVVKEATEEEAGLKEQTCEICGYKAEEVIPALGTPEETEEETEVEDPSLGAGEDIDAPETGDWNYMALFGSLLLVSMLGMAAVVVYSKRREVR